MIKNVIGLFPGQGSQFVGMGKYLFENFDIAKKIFEEASDAISVDLKKLCFNSDEEALALTENTQPALVTVSSATWSVLKTEFDIQYKYLAGHSVGEYSALVAAEVISFSDAVKSVKKRGQLMQSAVPVGEGGMIAVLGLSVEQVNFLCKWAHEKTNAVIEPANYNSPGQVVISGSMKAIKYIMDECKKEMFPEPPKRLKLIPLKVSAPFHCSLMLPAQEKMAEFLDSIEFASPKTSIIQNVTAKAETDVKEIKANIIKQLSAPVLWEQSLNSIADISEHLFFEIGPGKVISGLVKKTLGVGVTSFNSIDDIKSLG